MAKPGDARGGERSPNMGGGVTGGGRGGRRAGMEGGGNGRRRRGGERGEPEPPTGGETGQTEGGGEAGFAGAKDGRIGAESQMTKGLPTGGPLGGTMMGSRGGVLTIASGRGERGGVEGSATGAGRDCGIGRGDSGVPTGTQGLGPERSGATEGTRSPGMRGSWASNGRGRQTWFIVMRLAWAFRAARSWSCGIWPAMADNRKSSSRYDPVSRNLTVGRSTLKRVRQGKETAVGRKQETLATRCCGFFFF